MAATLEQYLLNPPKLVGPDYNIYHFTDGIYKVVKFKKPRDLTRVLSLSKPKKETAEPNTTKFSSSLSRARRTVLELALCNDWKYFCTFTLDKEKYDRYNLDSWREDFTQWIRDQRKKYRKLGLDFDCPFLLIPERHENGAWHMHGLMTVDPSVLTPFYCERQQGLNVPDKLVKGGYFDWPAYREKFGFCSFGKIKNKVACAFYVTKYITKDLDDLCSRVGSHLYYCSRGLARRTLHGSVYGNCDYLNTFLVNDYDFCKTGMTKVSDGLDWSFGVEYLDGSDIQPMEAFASGQFDERELRRIEEFFEYSQDVMEGF